MTDFLSQLDWRTFFLAMVLIELTPGPNMGWLAALSAQHGKRVGMMAVLGVTLGLGLQVIAAAAGGIGRPFKLSNRISIDPLGRRALHALARMGSLFRYSNYGIGGRLIQERIQTWFNRKPPKPKSANVLRRGDWTIC